MSEKLNQRQPLLQAEPEQHSLKKKKVLQILLLIVHLSPANCKSPLLLTEKKLFHQLLLSKIIQKGLLERKVFYVLSVPERKDTSISWQPR